MKFSIRDLLLVTVIVALALGWWIHQRGLNAKLIQERKLRSHLIEVNPTYRIWRENVASPLPNSSAPAPNPPKP